jgi:hypothetical protein
MGSAENSVQKQILDYLAYLPDCMAWRNNQFHVSGKSFSGMTGCSDIIGIYKGRFLAIEVKTSEGILSIEQGRFLDKINDHGGIAIVARCINDVMNVMTNRVKYEARAKSNKTVL